MRVLLSCLQSPVRHPIPAYDFWRGYFVNACNEAGIECVEVPGVDWAEGLTHAAEDRQDEWRSRAWGKTLEHARVESKSKPIDFFLGYLYPRQVERQAILELQRMGIPCVNFFCDNVRDFRRVPAEYQPFALHWVPEYEALDMYRRAKLPHLHAPMPCWVPQSQRNVAQDETEPATFIGSKDILRADFFGRAAQAGADFVVRGAGWSPAGGDAVQPRQQPRHLLQTLANQVTLVRQHGLPALGRKLADLLDPLNPPPMRAGTVLPGVSQADYVRITREACVVLGLNRVPSLRASNRHPLRYSRLRDIEAPMLGACYLTERTAGLEHMYETGSEIETFGTVEEFCVKLEGLKRDKARRRSMRERAQKKALHELSAARTLARICERLGLGARVA